MKLLICFFALLITLWGDELLVSFRIVTQNNRVSSQQFTVAKAMIPAKNPQIIAEFELPIGENEHENGAVKIVQNHQDELLAELMKHRILMTDNAESRVENIRAKTVITLPSVRISASVKEDLVSIAVIQN
ncbi:hypothetical protein FACS1894103_5220 [Campylobacterota bacterium]|nr:hypothetical protein FACS1894103_5220 [Campylobacterota bacterium]